MSTPINQHYVPQFLLRNFHNSNEKIHVFDKEAGGTFETNVRNVAAERNYYNFSHEGIEFSLEKPISEIEASAKKLIDLVVEKETLNFLIENDCSLLALFIAIQHLRGPRVRKDQELIAQALLERFGDSAEGKALIEKEWPSGVDNAKNFAIYFVSKEAHNHIPLFLSKTWLLFKSTEEQKFVISDTPVVLHNDNDYGPYGNLGLAVRGIQIFFPISPKLALGFYCPSIKKEFQEGLASYNKFLNDGVQLEEKYIRAIEEAKIYLNAADTGSLFYLKNENVLHINSLQIGFAERFVFSATNDFDLARDMVRKGHSGWGRIKLN